MTIKLSVLWAIACLYLAVGVSAQEVESTLRASEQKRKVNGIEHLLLYKVSKSMKDRLQDLLEWVPFQQDLNWEQVSKIETKAMYTLTLAFTEANMDKRCTEGMATVGLKKIVIRPKLFRRSLIGKGSYYLPAELKESLVSLYRLLIEEELATRYVKRQEESCLNTPVSLPWMPDHILPPIPFTTKARQFLEHYDKADLDEIRAQISMEVNNLLDLPSVSLEEEKYNRVYMGEEKHMSGKEIISEIKETLGQNASNFEICNAIVDRELWMMRPYLYELDERN